jgi:hypothetical protein
MHTWVVRKVIILEVTVKADTRKEAIEIADDIGESKMTTSATVTARIVN